MPSIKKWFLGILILPLAVLTLVYGTHFGLVKMTMNEQFKIAKVSIDKLETAFNSVSALKPTTTMMSTSPMATALPAIFMIMQKPIMLM